MTRDHSQALPSRLNEIKQLKSDTKLYAIKESF